MGGDKAIEAAAFQMCPVACKIYCATCVRKATACVAAYLAAMREAGRVMVPVEPTEGMISAAEPLSHVGDNYTPDLTWELMIAAAQEGE